MINLRLIDTMKCNPLSGAVCYPADSLRDHGGVKGRPAGTCFISAEHTQYVAGARLLFCLAIRGFFSLMPQSQTDIAMDARNSVYNAIVIMCDDLSDLELVTLNIVAQTDDNPHGRSFDYEKVRDLFTERGGLQMHQAAKEMLALYVLQRLG